MMNTMMTNILSNLSNTHNNRRLQDAIYQTKKCIPLYEDTSWKTIIGFSFWDPEEDPNAEEAFDHIFTDADVAAIDAVMSRR